MSKTIATQNMPLDEWRLHRQQGIGGSDIGAICGVNKYRTPLSVWYEKKGMSEAVETNKHMDWGTRLEDVIASKFADETGMVVTRTNRMHMHPEHPEFRCNPDRFISKASAPEGHGGRGILSIKMGSSYTFKDELVPLSYLYQLQWEMFVLDLTWGYIAWWETDTRDFKYHLVTRDQALVDMLVMTAKFFWKNVLDNVPPDPRLSDIEAMNVSKEGPTLTADAHMKGLLAKRQGYATDEKVYRDLKVATEEEIKQLVGEHARVVDSDGKTLLTYVSQTRKAFTVPEKTFRTLRVKNEKEGNQ